MKPMTSEEFGGVVTLSSADNRRIALSLREREQLREIVQRYLGQCDCQEDFDGDCDLCRDAAALLKGAE